MAVDRSNTCQGTDGTAVSTSNTAGPDQFTSVLPYGTGTSIAFSATQTHQGPTSIACHHPASNNSQAYVGWGLTVTTTAYARAYVYIPARASSVLRLIAAYGTSYRVWVNLLATGALRSVSAAGTVATTTATIPLNTWARVEMDITNISGTTADVAVRLYSGANVEGSTPDTGGSISNSGVNIGGAFNTLLFGNSTLVSLVAANDLYLDDLAISDTAQPGPYPPPSVVFEGWGVPV